MTVTLEHVFNFTSNGVIILINGQAEGILGLKRAQVLATPIIDTMPLGRPIHGGWRQGWAWGI